MVEEMVCSANLSLGMYPGLTRGAMSAISASKRGASAAMQLGLQALEQQLGAGAQGLGHAVGCAEAALDDDEDVVAVMLPDDLVLPTGVMEKMARVRAELGGSVLCAFNVTPDEVFNYGVFDVEDIDAQHDAAFDGFAVKKVI